ncbi:hypothetical protein ODJ79_42760 [Actinoplanes sp. KI2]|uniref:hypothetical protein n=1 Tax=Actinoplanes sp. KI2 TaxID=2983315 RepID=UPI0021D57FE7|nr:hypothetical protein [Actinoplanes sp. KI2]MCU7730479.1 hypothetical protein [Actinoplanes sp. KI2]
MPDEPPIGRAPRSPRGRARVGRAVGRSALPEHAVTGIVRQDLSSTDPIFVDPSGARRRRVRLVAYAIGVVLLLALAAVWASQLLGPATPPPSPPVVSAS